VRLVILFFLASLLVGGCDDTPAAATTTAKDPCHNETKTLPVAGNEGTAVCSHPLHRMKTEVVENHEHDKAVVVYCTCPWQLLDAGTI